MVEFVHLPRRTLRDDAEANTEDGLTARRRGRVSRSGSGYDGRDLWPLNAGAEVECEDFEVQQVMLMIQVARANARRPERPWSPPARRRGHPGIRQTIAKTAKVAPKTGMV